MALLDLIFSDGAALRDAERLLREQEDRVFKLTEGEDEDLGLHVRADIPRFEALNARQRLGQARQERKSDRLFVLSAMGFLVLAAKLFGGIDLIVKLLGAA